jgi:hypothetical protein
VRRLPLMLNLTPPRSLTPSLFSAADPASGIWYSGGWLALHPAS